MNPTMGGLGMKKLIFAAALMIAATGTGQAYLLKGSNSRIHSVQGHTTSSGTYVRSYIATNKNRKQRDRSATDDPTPYTGAIGTQNPRY
jgi:hypothetical protein